MTDTLPKLVLNCLHRSHFGGSQSRVAWCVNPLRERGWETLVVYPQDDEAEYAEYLRDEGVRFDRFRFRYLRSFKYWVNNLAFVVGLPLDIYRFFRIMRRERVAVVHVNGMTNLQPVLAARFAGVPVVWQWNDMLTPTLFGRLVRPLLTHRNLQLVVVARGILDKYSIHQVGGKMVPVWPEPFRPPEDVEGSHAPLEPAPRAGKRIGFVSNLVELKGILEFLDATDAILQERPDTEALVVGARFQNQPEFCARLDVRIADLVSGPRIHFLGYRRDIYNILNQIDCFVFPSHTEACPIVILEAMWAGVPIVATDVGEVGEMLAGCGVPIVAVGDVGGLIAGIRSMLALSSDERRDIAAGMRARALERYGLDRVIDLHCAAYESAVACP